MQKTVNYTLSEESIEIIFIVIIALIVVTGTRFVDIFNRFLLSVKLIILIIVCGLFLKIVHLNNLFIEPMNIGTSLIVAIPIFITSFAAHVVIPPLSDYLDKNQKDLYKSVIIGCSIPLVLYFLWLISILGTLPLKGDISFINSVFSKVEHSNVGDVLNAIDQKINASFTSQTLNVFTNISIVTSYLSVSMALYHFTIDSYKLHKLSKIFKISSAVILTFMLPFIVNIMNGDLFITALSYVSIPLCIISVVIPILVIRKMHLAGEKTNYTISTNKKLWLFGLLIAMVIIVFQLIGY